VDCNHAVARLLISGDLEQVVMACLEKSPNKRPQNALELSKMLSDCQVDEPWTPERAESWWRMHHPENLDSRLFRSETAASNQV